MGRVYVPTNVESKPTPLPSVFFLKQISVLPFCKTQYFRLWDHDAINYFFFTGPTSDSHCQVHSPFIHTGWSAACWSQSKMNLSVNPNLCWQVCSVTWLGVGSSLALPASQPWLPHAAYGTSTGQVCHWTQHESKTRNPIKGHKGQRYTAIAMFMVLVNLQKILLKKTTGYLYKTVTVLNITLYFFL